MAQVAMARKMAHESRDAAAAPRVPRKCVDSAEHRDKGVRAQVFPNLDPNFHAAVARKVPRNKWKEPAAKAALDKEWDKLVNLPWPKGPVPGKPGSGSGKGCWDYAGVREAADVRNEARTKGVKMHFGRVAELLYEKGGELPEGHPDRKMKARCVFLGDNIRDEHFNYAVFDEIGNSPSSIEAGRVVDAFSLFDGYVQEQSDAVSAYTQSFLTGPPTWVAVPHERWPKEWAGMKNPVCPLVLNLYGHPLAGNIWGDDCEERVLKCGWQ